MDFSKVLGGALWWLQRMATARLALLYDRILAGTLSSAAGPTMIQWHASTKFTFISPVLSTVNPVHTENYRRCIHSQQESSLSCCCRVMEAL